MSEERRFFSSVWRSERMPIVTLSKSMSRAAFRAWEPANAVWDIACGPRYTGAIGCDPRCIGATCRCAPDGADRCDLELIFCGISCARLRACVAFLVAATAARRVIPATFAAGG